MGLGAKPEVQQYTRGKLAAAEKRLRGQIENRVSVLTAGTAKIVQNSLVIESFLVELKSKLTILNDKWSALEDQEDVRDGTVNKENNDVAMAGVVPEGNLIFKERRVLKSQSYTKGKLPTLFILQGVFSMRHREKEVRVRIGISWPEPVLFIVCFPYLEDVEPDFFGHMQMRIGFIDCKEKVCLEKSFVVQAFNGTCLFSASATNVEHLNCEDSTHEETLSDEETFQLQNCFELRDSTKDSCFYSLQLNIELMSLSQPNISVDEGTSAASDASEEADFLSSSTTVQENELGENETSINELDVKAVISGEMHKGSKLVDALGFSIEADVNKEMRVGIEISATGDTLYENYGEHKSLMETETHSKAMGGTNHVTNVSGVSDSVEICKPVLQSINVMDENVVKEPVQLEMENPLINKISANAVSAFKSWAKKSNTSWWSRDIAVNLELLHFSHRVQLPELMRHVLRNLQTVEDREITLEFAIDVLAAAQMYRIEMPELMQRTAHFILDKKC